jgi:hypothetical protein
MGWYDYSFQDPILKLREIFYRRKSIPGLVTMNDVQFVKWRFSDKEFTALCAERLAADLRNVSRRVDRIVAVTHFVPFESLIPPLEGLPLMFARAFIGSAELGRVLRRFRKVRYVFAGHAHLESHAQVGPIRARLVGSSRRRAVLCRLSLPSGKVRTRRFPVPWLGAAVDLRRAGRK